MVPSVIVCSGSRTITRTMENALIVEALLVGLHEHLRAYTSTVPFEIVHGAAPGLDQLVQDIYELRWAEEPMVQAHPTPADWPHCGPECPPTTGHRRTRWVPGGTGELVAETYCPWAGGRRNQAMIDDRKPHFGLCFVDKPQHLSRGTDDMVKRLKTARIAHAVIHLHLGGT